MDFRMGTTCRATTMKSRMFDWTHTSHLMAECAHFKFIRGVCNSNFRLFALVKTRDESRWRRSLRPVDVMAVILRVVLEIIYSTLLTLMIVLDLLMSTYCSGPCSVASFRFLFVVSYNVYTEKPRCVLCQPSNTCET
jgi:hypothetical protein